MTSVPTDPTTPVPGYGSPPERVPPSWRLKLAVLLVIATLCIAFAGLIWALIF